MKSMLNIVVILLASIHCFAQIDRPNVVFILADDLGVNALGCYGNDFVETPAIDQLAKEGIRFTNAYSNDPTCAPSRASIMTGQYVPRHKIYRVSDRYKKDQATLQNMQYLPPENNKPNGKGVGLSLDKVLIPEALKENGYATAGFGKWHLGTKELSMQNQGFDEAIETKKHYNFTHFPTQTDVLENDYNADYITKKGIAFIEKQVNNNTPFFLFLPYYLVHKPLEPKLETYTYFKDKYNFDEETTKVLAMIKNLDESVAKVLSSLKKLNIEDNTLIIFASDNGHYKTSNGMFTKPYQGYKGNTLEGGIRVPYIMKYSKKIKANQVSTSPIIHVDIYPTILSFTNTLLPKKHVLDGVNLQPITTGEKKLIADRKLIWQYTNYSRFNKKSKKFTAEWVNVIQYKGFKMTEFVENNTYKLFDLTTDPYEQNEITNVLPQKIKELSALLQKWKEDTNAELPRVNPAYIHPIN
ncbi:sulfatase-like hydrolase/transferase [Flammeovirga kamogawensis]|uniref:Sulfatase-like hydrolase/transferase n=2 Tax=Flammeovirga kamogawensis TaxID=373891 RepID=A0ABX8H0Q9_9BACT|nr:sulfatase-like hydrolase/transferase [Flammeovirga kamogawensis]MBB6462360.1 arylsulfatase A-like enzyme [Flammeovirga kamogawensis]QWG09474.1 sulfatase-like hydrolase/transferase [Flammeovirga kamogawensis]TRX64990.1 sulfatase-like hydrolase/transferase [Flammeovirga kamogawensis]